MELICLLHLLHQSPQKKTASASEQWVLISQGGCEYSLQSSYGTYLRANVGGKIDLQPSITSKWEVFKFSGRELNRSIKTCFGNYIRAHPGGDGSKVDLKGQCGAWETFTIEKDDDKILFHSLHNTYLCAHPGDNGRIELQSRKGLSEKWTMILHNEEPRLYSFQSCHGSFVKANQDNTLTLRVCDIQNLSQYEKFIIFDGVDVSFDKIVGAKVSSKLSVFGDSLKKVTKK